MFELLFYLLVYRSSTVGASGELYCSPENAGGSSGAFNSSSQSQLSCSDRCGGFQYAILQSSNCWCSNQGPSSVVPIDQCDEGCPGYSLESCGSVEGGLFQYVHIGDGSSSSVSSSSVASSTQFSQSATSIPESIWSSSPTISAGASTYSANSFLASSSAGTASSETFFSESSFSALPASSSAWEQISSSVPLTTSQVTSSSLPTVTSLAATSSMLLSSSSVTSAFSFSSSSSAVPTFSSVTTSSPSSIWSPSTTSSSQTSSSSSSAWVFPAISSSESTSSPESTWSSSTTSAWTTSPSATSSSLTSSSSIVTSTTEPSSSAMSLTATSQSSESSSSSTTSSTTASTPTTSSSETSSSLATPSPSSSSSTSSSLSPSSSTVSTTSSLRRSSSFGSTSSSTSALTTMYSVQILTRTQIASANNDSGFTTRYMEITQTILATGTASLAGSTTSTAQPIDPVSKNHSNGTDAGYWSSPGKVAGTFVPIGVCVAIIIIAVWYLIRRKRRLAEKFEAGYNAAALSPHFRSSSSTSANNSQLFVYTDEKGIIEPTNPSTDEEPPTRSNSVLWTVDQRLDPRRMLSEIEHCSSKVSLADDVDYSRKVLRVINE